MKAIFFSMLILLFSFYPSHSQDKQERILVYERILQCQATYKIVAYYVDIYQSLRSQLENGKSEKGAKLGNLLREEWTNFEDLAVGIKRDLMTLGVDASSLETDRYTLFVNALWMTIINSNKSPEEIIKDHQKMVNQCSDVIAAIKKNLPFDSRNRSQ